MTEFDDRQDERRHCSPEALMDALQVMATTFTFVTSIFCLMLRMARQALPICPQGVCPKNPDFVSDLLARPSFLPRML